MLGQRNDERPDAGVTVMPTPPRRVKLDQAALAKQGFFSEVTRGDELSLELRAIKRRLLRRLEYHKRVSGRDARDSDALPPRNLVLVTSTRPAEGKTFTAVNLALSLAFEDRIPVVLVDADLPRPRVLHHLRLNRAEYGLHDLIREPGLRDPDGCMLMADDVPLRILPEGSGGERPQDFFAAAPARGFFEALASAHPDSLVIVDAPPVLATPDAVLLAPYMDEILFVIEAGGTPEKAVATALDELMEQNEQVSLVLNRCLVAEKTTQYGSYDEYYRQGRGER